MYQQLLGNNAAAIYDPRTGLRFMNDLATYEIFWHFLYLTVFKKAWAADGIESRFADKAMAVSSIAAWLIVLYAGRMLPFLGNAF